MRVSRSDGLRCDFSTNKHTISVSNMSLYTRNVTLVVGILVPCDLSCSTTNVIYLISCAKCDRQYVGETKQKVSARLSGHRSAIKKHANTFIARHFNLPGHTMDDIRIQPILNISHRTLERPRKILPLDA